MPTDAPSVPPNQEDPSEADQWLPVGTVVGVQGLRGELRVNPASDFPERFTDPGPRWLQAKGGAPQPVDLRSGRQLPGKSLFVVRLAGVDNRSAAEALVGHTLLVQADDRPELAEGEFHLLDLVGLEARLSAEGEAIGTVQNLISGGNDLLVLERPDGRTLMIPFVESIVPEVHPERGWLLLTPPPGLLELWSEPR
jgi:16S rRNA processing protein RimM